MNINDFLVNLFVALISGVAVAVLSFFVALKTYRGHNSEDVILFASLAGFIIGALYGYWHAAIRYRRRH
jgi:membrane associated rhomboid family serine protease